jgi:hypothetical protein
MSTVRGRRLAGVVAGLLLIGASLRPLPAQRGEGAPAAAAHVPAGTRFTARLEGPIDAATTRVGHRFTARVIASVTEPQRAVVPIGAIVTGTIRGIQRAHGTLAPAFVRLTIESLSFDGRSQLVRAAVEDVQLPAATTRRPDARRRSRSLPEVARGAVLVEVNAGDRTGGSLISLGTDDASLRLPQGTLMTLRVN